MWVDKDARIYIARNNGWDMKGRFRLAVTCRDEIPWRVNSDGETFVGIRAVGYMHQLKWKILIVLIGDG
jgi:hypothetical protein